MNSNSAIEKITNDVIELAQSRMSSERADAMQHFVDQYLRGVSEEDLCEFRTSDLYGACVAHWNFLLQRKTDQALVRAYNPHADEHGWQSTHTIIEVVCNDMPFLVDSLRMALERRGITVHLLIHPVIQILRDANGKAQRALAVNDTETDANVTTEAIMHFEVDRQVDVDSLLSIEQEMTSVLNDVSNAVVDWVSMRDQLQQVLEQLQTAPPKLATPDDLETRERY